MDILARIHIYFELDGLIYDETKNILYMVESKFHLSETELIKAEETWGKLKFIS